MPHIQIKNLSLKFKNFELKNINLEINKGEYFVILGESGAGKSLLIECITGLHNYKGKIFINGVDIENIPIEKRNIGVVYQEHILFPNLNVYENVAFGLKFRIKDKKEIDRRVREISKKLKISHLLERKIENLSGGEKQRIILARTLLVNPEIMLLDEPLSALDPNMQKEILEEIKTNIKGKITTIHITHNFEEAISLADRIGIMLKGEILQIGKPEEIFKKPKNEIVAKFIGIENLFEGISKIENGISIINVENKIEIISTNLITGKVHLIIPPESIVISKTKILTTARNIFKGKICEISNKERIIKITVDIKIPIVVYITRQSYEELNLNVNDEVYIYFKASSVHVF